MKHRNQEFSWDSFDPAFYNKQYSGKPPLPEDVALTEAFIKAVNQHPQLSARLGTTTKALDICSGGVLRHPGLLYPFLNCTARQASFVLGDIGSKVCASADTMLQDIKHGDLGIWQIHQDDMARHDPKWQDAISKVSNICQTKHLSIFDLPKKEFDVIGTAFGPESLTEDPKEFAQAIHSWLGSGKPGAIVSMMYMVGSNGYMVGDVHFPAIPIYLETLEKLIGRKVKILEHFFTPTASLHTVRADNDPTHYDGMALLLGILK